MFLVYVIVSSCGSSAIFLALHKEGTQNLPNVHGTCGEVAGLETNFQKSVVIPIFCENIELDHVLYIFLKQIYLLYTKTKIRMSKIETPRDHCPLALHICCMISTELCPVNLFRTSIFEISNNAII